MPQTDELRTLRHWLRRAENCVASEPIAIVSGIGIPETLALLPPGEIATLAQFARDMIDSGKTGEYTQMYVTPQGPVTGNTVSDGFVVDLYNAIQRQADAESDGGPQFLP